LSEFGPERFGQIQTLCRHRVTVGKTNSSICPAETLSTELPRRRGPRRRAPRKAAKTVSFSTCSDWSSRADRRGRTRAPPPGLAKKGFVMCGRARAAGVAFRLENRFSRRPHPPPGPPNFENSTGFRADGGRGWRSRRRRSPTPPSPGSPISRFGPAHAEKNREVCIQRLPSDRHAPYGGGIQKCCGHSAGALADQAVEVCTANAPSDQKPAPCTRTTGCSRCEPAKSSPT